MLKTNEEFRNNVVTNIENFMGNKKLSINIEKGYF